MNKGSVCVCEGVRDTQSHSVLHNVSEKVEVAPH